MRCPLTLRALDLFAGAGGLSLGLKLSGFDVRGLERDEEAASTHRGNVGPCECGDVREYHPAPNSFDLVAGGPPCQKFSESGRREGFLNPEGLLYREQIRVAVESDASAILLENVEGMKSLRGADKWTALAHVEADMRAAGYDTKRQILSAADYGVPQERYRLFVVAFRSPRALAAFRWPAPTHADPLRCRLLGLLPWVTMREALELGENVYQTGRREGAKGWQGERLCDVDRPANVQGTRQNADLISPLDMPAFTVGAGGTKTGGAEPFANQGYRKRLAAGLARIDAPAPTIKANSNDETMDPTRASRRPMAELNYALSVADLLNRPSTTVCASRGTVTKADHHHRKEGATRLSPSQLATLQDFPPGFVFCAATLGSLHRQIGNAVPMRLGAAVSGAVRLALES